MSDVFGKEIKGTTFLLIKPRGLSYWPLIKRKLAEKGSFSRFRLVLASNEIMEKHYEEHTGREFFQNLTSNFDGQYVLAVEIKALPGEIKKLKGPADPKDPENKNGDTIRGLVNSLTPKGTMQVEWTGGFDNLIHSSDANATERELDLWFNLPVPESPDYLCLMNRKLDIENCVSPFVGIKFDLENSDNLMLHITDLLRALPWISHWSKAGVQPPKLIVGGIPSIQIIALQYLTSLTGKTFDICWLDVETASIESVGLRTIKDKANLHRERL